jgi:hypothetical protein
MPRKPRTRQPLGQRIFTCYGVVCDPPEANLAINVGKSKVLCSCGSIVLRIGYSYHIKREGCMDYHKLVQHEPYIVKYIA